MTGGYALIETIAHTEAMTHTGAKSLAAVIHPPPAVALVISTPFGTGGKERVVEHLADQLAQRGVRVLVVSLVDPTGEIQAGPVTSVGLGSGAGRDLSAVWRLAALFRRFRPIVINVHDRSSLVYASMANRLAGHRPIVLSCHGLLLGDTRRARQLERWAMRQVKAMTAVSPACAEEYARLLSYSEPVMVIRNGVPHHSHDPAARGNLRMGLGLDDGTLVFLSVGNINPEKGHQDLLEAVKKLSEQRLDGDFVVLVAGSQANTACWEEVRDRWQRLGDEQQVRFLGFRQDVERLYSAADAFVLPSRKEALPMALLEAMSAGLPVVATAVGDIPEVIGDQAGLLVPPSSPDALAQAMAKLLASAGLRGQLGQEAARRVDHEYSVSAMADRYLDVYCQVTRPRVVMLGPLPPPTGGMATVLEGLRRSRLAERCDLTVLNNGKTTPRGRSFLTGSWAQAKLAWRVARLARPRGTIVHIHTCSGFTFWRDCLHMTITRWLGSKGVWHIHGGQFDRFTGSLGRVKRWLMRRALESSAVVIVLGDAWIDKLRRFAPCANWRTVPNGVPMRPLHERKNAANTPFLFLGSLEERKGALDLVDAVSKAAAKGFPGVVRIAGPETAASQGDRLRARIADRGCGDRVHWVGSLIGQDKEDALAGADCFVLPSYGEGLPMAMLEAMAHGVPVIVTRVGAIPEAVTDGVEGFVIEPGDTDALADRMLRIANDPELRARMGQAARRRVQEKYSLDTMVDRLMEVYRKVTDGERP